MKIKAVKGTRDYLPKEVALREYIERTIMSVYKENGFQRIMTPTIEDIENLDKSDGGENLNLIFKILKRGEKLNNALSAQKYDELSDMGLRYDLTLPLTRYFSAGRQSLTYPFKCIQIDRVYRAERPQKGRLREFMQCDIDIIGDKCISCEIELITVTAKALSMIDIGDFTIRVNDRQLLNSLLSWAGFEDNQLASVCISFDKLDKIGAEGVISELTDKGFSEAAIKNFSEILSRENLSLADISEITGKPELTKNISKVIADSTALSEGKYDIVFDISLVRGQGYYTGTVFEVMSNKFKGAVAGGGRYDNLIGKFTGENIAACGFSIGFERIFSILCDLNRTADDKKRIAVIYDDDFITAYRQAEELRTEYNVAIYQRPKKMKSFLDKLSAGGFYGFYVIGRDSEIEIQTFSSPTKP